MACGIGFIESGCSRLTNHYVLSKLNHVKPAPGEIAWGGFDVSDFASDRVRLYEFFLLMCPI